MLKNKTVFALLFAVLSLSVTMQTVNAGATGVDTIYLCGGPPTGGVWAQFKVSGGETFNAYITDPASIDDAIRLFYKPTSSKHIPIGRLVCEPALWNCSWGWHQLPSSVVFAENAIEICDGIPSHIEPDCKSFQSLGGGYYCPWTAVMVQLLDCRVDPGCPAFRR